MKTWKMNTSKHTPLLGEGGVMPQINDFLVEKLIEAIKGSKFKQSRTQKQESKKIETP